MAACQALNDNTKKLNGGYWYRRDGLSHYIVHENIYLKRNIYSDVVSMITNDQYILVKQIPNKNYHRAMLRTEIIFDIQDPNATEILLNRTIDSVLENDVKYKKIFSNKENYWIIDIQNDLFLGPFNYEEYESIRKTLKIPTSMELK